METNWGYQDDADAILRRMKRKERILRERRRRRNKIMAIAILTIVIIIAVIVGFAIRGAKKGKEDAKPSSNPQVEQEIPVAEEEVPEEEPEEVPPAFAFESTATTRPIDLETVISGNAILVANDTDTIVAEKGAKERISPASMTKVLTILVAAEHIPEEKLNDTFTMTIEITDYSYSNGCSSVGFLDEEVIPVIDMFYGTILSSGADAALGLATYVAGSHEAFMELMNQKLVELGLGSTSHFTNCVGIYDENHYSTVYDMAVIMKAALENELCRKVLGERVYVTSPTAEHPEGLTISNWFIRRIEDKDAGGTILGAKTGYVVESGNCAVSYGEFGDGEIYICATAGASSNWRCIYDHVDIYNEYVIK